MFAGIAVFEGNQTFNISHEFPCFLGYSPNKHLSKADVACWWTSTCRGSG